MSMEGREGRKKTHEHVYIWGHMCGELSHSFCPPNFSQENLVTTVSKEEWVGSQGEASSLSHHAESTVIRKTSVLSCHMASDPSLPLCNQKAHIQIVALLPEAVIIHAIEL